MFDGVWGRLGDPSVPNVHVVNHGESIMYTRIVAVPRTSRNLFGGELALPNKSVYYVRTFCFLFVFWIDFLCCGLFLGLFFGLFLFNLEKIV